MGPFGQVYPAAPKGGGCENRSSIQAAHDRSGVGSNFMPRGPGSPEQTGFPGSGMRESASALKTRCSRNRKSVHRNSHTGVLPHRPWEAGYLIKFRSSFHVDAVVLGSFGMIPSLQAHTGMDPGMLCQVPASSDATAKHGKTFCVMVRIK